MDAVNRYQGSRLSQIAEETRALRAVAAEVRESFGRVKGSKIITSDSSLLLASANPRKASEWLDVPLSAWLKENVEWNAHTRGSSVVRWLAVPGIRAEGNTFVAQSRQRAVILNLHFHLLHGILLNVLVYDPNEGAVGKMSGAQNLCAMPAYRVAFDIEGFYEGRRDLQVVTITREAYAERSKEFEHMVHGASSVHQLWYNERSFERRRLHGSRWEALRRLFWCLWYGEPLCGICKAVIPRGKYHLDHVIPLYHPDSNNTLMNLVPTHRRCNLRKSKILPDEDPHDIPLWLPPEVKSKGLEKILRTTPAWLGSIDRPSREWTLNGSMM